MNLFVIVIPRPPRDLLFSAGQSGGHHRANDV
jgi:hypothetical protein